MDRDRDSTFSTASVFVGLFLFLTILAIAIRPVRHGRERATEAQAIGDIRTIISAEQTFASVNCGFFDDLVYLCKAGVECRGIPRPDYEGPDFLGADLGRASPYKKDGYERRWTPNGSPDPSKCATTPTTSVDYCYMATPSPSTDYSVRSFVGTGSGAIYVHKEGGPLPCPVPPGTASLE